MQEYPAILCILVGVQVKFYISIALATMAPFNCYEPPDGDKSVQGYPAILGVLVKVQVKLYISIVLDIFAHFDCYEHPDGDESVQENPAEHGNGGRLLRLQFAILA